MKTIQEQIAVMQHFANSGSIECKPQHSQTWTILSHPNWDWSRNDYRIAQPPKQKLYQWIIQTDSAFWITDRFFPNKDAVLVNNPQCSVIKPALWTEIEL